MKIHRYFLWTIIFFALFLFFISGIRMLYHPYAEFDEGVYAVTFWMRSLGFPLYTSTFLSQPPGFYLLLSPFFLFIGNPLLAGRLGVFIWSFLGIGGVFFVSQQLKDRAIGILSLALLYLVPLYTSEILTFHADSLPVIFSLIALGMLLRFLHTKQTVWYVLSWIGIGIALSIKGDITFLSVILIFSVIEKISIKKLIMGIATLLLCIVLFSFPFGMQNVMRNVILLRLHATNTSTFNPLHFFQYLIVQKELLFFVVGGIILSIPAFLLTKQKKDFMALFLWLVTVIVGLMIYHPLFVHHMFFVIVPTVLFFSFSAVTLLRQRYSSQVVIVISTALLLASALLRMSVAFHSSTSVLNSDQKKGVEIIQKYTTTSDMIVSDDGLLTIYAQRKTPPVLTDISYVRLDSDSLNGQIFQQQLEKYRPLLLLSWNGRLMAIPHFQKIIEEDGYAKTQDSFPGHAVFMRKK